MNLGFGRDEPLQLDVNRYSADPVTAAFANVVHDEIESRRVALGGVYGGHRGWLLGSLLKVEEPTHGDYENRRHWFEYLTDLDVIEKASQRLNVTTLEFLSTCMKKLRPPNWESLFWMHAFFRSAVGTHEFTAQIALREAEVARRARSETATKGANAKLAKDPKQKAKAFIRLCWEGWQEEPSLYFSKAEFAREMRQRPQCKSLSGKNNRKIVSWCGEFEKERAGLDL